MPSSQQFRINMIADPERGALRMSCQNSDCEQERNGWLMVLDPDNAKHRDAMDFIVNDSGRRYFKVASEQAIDALARLGDQLDVVNLDQVKAIAGRTPPGMVLFVFARHQQCFRQHVDREVEFVHRTARGTERVHERPVDFNEHVNEEAYRAGVLRQRG